LVSGSADKDVKFWDFEMREQADGEGERVVSRLGVETVVSGVLPSSIE
jgi:U3 small nucleolar RNA-associated protein 12